MDHPIECLYDGLFIDATVTPSPQLKKLAEGYCISSQFVDSVDFLHYILGNRYDKE